MNKLSNLTLTKQKNILHGLTCYEPVDIECLDKILNSDLLNLNPEWNEEVLLQKYKKVISPDTHLANIKYERTKGMNFGRCNPVNCIGLHNIRKALRHTLARKIGFSDWDIKNAHPVMLLQVCKARGIVCTHLEYYVNHRDTILEKLTKITGCDEDRAKMLFIRILYFGTFKNWLKEQRDKLGKLVYKEICIYAFQYHQDIMTFINDFTDEILKIGQQIIDANPKIAKEIEKRKEEQQRDEYNIIGSTVSYFLQEYEVRVLECIYTYCLEKGYIEDNKVALCADGIMLDDRLIKDANIPVEFNKLIKEKIGFDLVIVNKALDKYIPDSEISEHILSIKLIEDDKLKRFDSHYFTTLNNYKLKKIYFENFVCKILRPDPCYIYAEHEGNNEVLNFYTQGKITETFNHYGSAEYNTFGIEIKFMTKWLGDEKIRLYNKMDFLPYNDRQPTPDYIFNLFRGFSSDTKQPFDRSKKDRLLKPFHDLGIELCGGDEKHYRFLYTFLADIIQNPHKKNPIAFIIKGKQGTGKNVFFNVMANLLGKSHFISSANPKDFFGDYAEGFYHKLLVIMNECEGKDTFDFEGRIKSFITEDHITLNRKFVQPITILNLARLIITTNKHTPIPIDVFSKDRRYVVFETTDKYLDPMYGTSFWTKLCSHFNRPDFLACLYDDMNNLDISEYNWKVERPITKAYTQMISRFIPPEVLFLEHKITTMVALFKENITFWETDGYKGTDLFNDYTKYCKDFGFYREGSFQKNIKSFYGKLEELQLPMVVSKPHNIQTYKFNADDVLKFMKSKKWIDRADEDNDNDIIPDVEGGDFKDYFDV